MLYCALLLAAMLTAQQSPSSALANRVVEPFSLDLPLEGEPSALLPMDSSGTLQVSAARGETTCFAVLCLRPDTNSGRIKVRARPATGPDGKIHDLIDLFLIKGLPRNNPYLQAMLGREGLARISSAYPDILIKEEPLSEESQKKTGPEGTASFPCRDGVTADLLTGQNKYLLLRARIPSELGTGTYRASIEAAAQDDAVQFALPVEIQVLPFTLPAHGKVLSVANDFSVPGSPHFEPSLRDQSEHGMTSTRLKGAASPAQRAGTFPLLEALGFTHLIHGDPPRDAEEARPVAGGIQQYFYGVDEPQPKGRDFLRPWSRMADHVRLSRQIHGLGGRVVTSIIYPLALELSEVDSSLYRELRGYGIDGAPEPLDWASYGLGLQRLGRGNGRGPREPRMPVLDRETGGQPGETAVSGPKRRSTYQEEDEYADNSEYGGNHEFFRYIEALQKEYADGATLEGRTPRSKHKWLETYYFPLGYMKSPFYARLLFGYYLFNSHLDGVSAWTLFRPKNNPYTDRDGPDPVIAYPSGDGMIPTYWWEAVREGVNDLRYCRLAEDLLIELENRSPEKGREMRRRLVSILSPYQRLVAAGERIDRSLELAVFRRTRSELEAFILQLQGAEQQDKTSSNPVSKGGNP